MKYKLIVIIGVFLVSFASIFVKLINPEQNQYVVQPTVIAMYRLGISGLILLPFALTNKDFKKLKIKDFGIIIIAGIVISLHYFSWFTALGKTSATSSTLIICTQPLVALLFGFLLYKEKISRKKLVALFVAMIGVGVVAWGDIHLDKDALIGDALTFLAVIFFVIYLTIGQNVVKKFSFIIYTSILFLCAGIILFIYNMMMGYNLIYYPKNIWIYLSLIVLIPNTGQLIFNYTLRYVKSSLVSTAILLEPIIVTILAVIILTDPIIINHYVGGFIIITSVYFYLRQDKVKQEAHILKKTDG